MTEPTAPPSPPPSASQAASPGASSGASPGASPEGAAPRLLARRLLVANRLLAAILVLMLCGAFYVASAFFMPLVLALLFALTLRPIIRGLRRRRVPEGLAAVIVVGLAGIGVISLIFALAAPVLELARNAPQMAWEVRERVEEIRAPLEEMTEAAEQAAEQVDEATNGGDEKVAEVAVRKPGILTRIAGSAAGVLTTAAITAVLTLFLLASGEHFYSQIIKSFPRFRDKKRAMQTVRDIERQISRYLLTITAINSLLGLSVGLAAWVLGMETPLLWGLVAALVNYVPYIGPVFGILAMAAMSLVTFDSLGQAMLPPLAYFTLNLIEGQFVTPMVVGRRLSINTVAVFVAVAFWSFMWGVTGALMAVPLIVLLKVLCDHIEGLSGIGRFLSASDPGPLAGEEPEEQPGRAA